MSLNPEVRTNLNRLTSLKIPASDGYTLSALIGHPEKSKRGQVVISSATAVKKEFYIPYADF